ncbi:MAG: hypothetical protein QXR62_05740 [Candidatus Bathyarchaeia archaeon]
MSAGRPKITKQLVYEGLKHRVEVEVEEFPGYIFVLAPLTDAEFSEYRAAALEGVDTSRFRGKRVDEVLEDLDSIDLVKLVKAGDRAKHIALAYSLSRGMGEKWTPEDVANLPAGVPDKLFAKLDEICALTAKMRGEVRNFR